MRGCTLLLLTIASAAALSRQTPAQGFTPNHMFLTYNHNDSGTIVELDSKGLHVRTITIPNVSFAYNLSFGPNGNLFVAFAGSNTIGEVDAGGNLLQQFAGSGHVISPSALVPAADGHWNIINSSIHSVTELQANGNYIRDFSISSTPLDTVYGGGASADGHTWAGAAESGKIISIDPSGVVTKTATPNLSSPNVTCVVTAADGHILAHVSNSNSHVIEEFNEHGVYISSIVVDSPFVGFGIGPDSNIYIPLYNGTMRVYSREGALLNSINLPSMPNKVPINIGFSPYRFQSKLTGAVARPGAPPVPVNETVILQYAPNSGRVSIQFTDDPNKPFDFASLYGAAAMNFYGFEVNKNDLDKTRTYQGMQVSTPSGGGGVASLSMLWNGNVTANAPSFVVKKGRGSVHRAGVAGLFDGLVTTVKAVP